MRIRLWALVLMLGSGLGARAQFIDLSAEASLVSDAVRVAPGTTFTLGLRLVLPKDAYVYWRNPGDAGLRTTMTWDLPEGVSAGDIVWPAPEVFDEPPLRSFGYKNEVVLPVPFRIAADWAPPGDGRLRVGLQAEWLICREACVPGATSLSIALPVSDRIEPDPSGAALIARYRDREPVRDTGWTGRFRLESDRLEVDIAAPEGAPWPERTEALFLPYEEGLVEPAAAQRVRRTGTGAEMVLSRDVMRKVPGPRIEGILLFTGPTGDRTSVEVVLKAEET